MKIGFIGCGNMGGALARAAAKTEGNTLYLADFDVEKLGKLAKETNGAAETAEKIASVCDMIFLGVKPVGILPLLKSLSPLLKKNSKCVIVSMAAGVSIGQIESENDSNPIIRIMPNTPVGYGEGMILASVNSRATEENWSAFLAVMKAAGKIDKIDERFIDAGSAVSGSGPAFVYMFIEALADGGVAAGLPREKALEYAIQTLKGAAVVVKESGKHPEQLKDEVCSPGGSTIEGVLTLEGGSFRGVVADAVVATYEKAKTLGKSK